MEHRRNDPAASPGELLIEIDEYARTYLLNDEVVQKLEWNGREIRNVLQTAISLARYKAMKDPKKSKQQKLLVTKDHFKSVVQMSQSFKHVHVGQKE